MDATIVRKTHNAELLDVTAGSREVVACISAACVDRDNEVVLPAGCARKNYAGMTVFYDHDTAMPLGTCQWVKASADKLLAKHRFTDKTELGRDMFALVQDGVLRCYSIGFQPQQAPTPPTAAELASNPQWKGASRVYRAWELLEYSLVGVPANPEAVQIAVSKGICSARTAERLKRVPVKPEAADEGEKDGYVTLNRAGEAHARMLISQGKIDRDNPWTFDGDDGNAMLGEHGGDWSSYSRCFLGDDMHAGDQTKARWKYPVIKKGKVYISGLRAAISRAGQQGSSAIEDAARGLLAAAEARKNLTVPQIKLALVRGATAIYGRRGSHP